MHLPYSLQLAHGWTRLAATANLAAVVVLVPAIYFSVKAFGVIAAPVVWITLNSGYVALGVPLMHRKLLGGEMWRWYGQDVLAPTFAALAAAALARAATPAGVLDEPLESVGAVLIVAGLTLFGAALASPLGRSQLYGYFRFAVQLR